MSLQVYYLFISFYGWYHWSHGKGTEKEPVLPVVKISKKQILYLSMAFLVLLVTISFTLERVTDSDVPWGDSFTTAGSIVATWMLARKILEHWIIWLVVDAVYIIMYLDKELYATVALFIVYTIMAIVGFIEWQKKWKIQIIK